VGALSIKRCIVSSAALMHFMEHQLCSSTEFVCKRFVVSRVLTMSHRGPCSEQEYANLSPCFLMRGSATACLHPSSATERSKRWRIDPWRVFCSIALMHVRSRVAID
jgi:hypothetical protein